MTNAGAVTIADDAVTGDKISDSAALPDGVTATTQTASDNSTKVATTAFVKNGFSPATYAGEESVTLPNGLIMKMGISTSVGADSSRTVAFGTAFNAVPITVQLTKYRGLTTHGAGELTVDNVTASQFVIRNGLDGSGQVYWFAIGR